MNSLTHYNKTLSDFEHYLPNITVTESPKLYWQVGRRINEDTLKGERTEYREQIVVTLLRQLNWSQKTIYRARLTERTEYEMAVEQ